MANPVLFATDAWIKRLGDECNKSEAYREAAKNWEGDIYFIVEPEGYGQDPIYMYMDLYHGRCRQAFVPEDCSTVNPEFHISGSMKVWRAIAQKEMDPVKALLTRQLSLKGNMAKVMKNARAANELVNCTTRVETEFPATW
jgi:putative sterol carrier protein